MPFGDLVRVFVRRPRAVAFVALGVQKGFVAGGKRYVTCLIASEQVAVSVEVGFEGNFFGGVRGVLDLDDDNGVEVVAYCRVIRVGEKLFSDYLNPVHGIAERHGDRNNYDYDYNNGYNRNNHFFPASQVRFGLMVVIVTVIQTRWREETVP